MSVEEHPHSFRGRGCYQVGILSRLMAYQSTNPVAASSLTKGVLRSVVPGQAQIYQLALTLPSPSSPNGMQTIATRTHRRGPHTSGYHWRRVHLAAE